MFGLRKDQRFESALRKSLRDGFVLPDEIWDLIHWLEGKGQCFQYRNNSALFIPTTPVEGFDHIWSHLAFVIEPDLVRNWFGKDGLEESLLPIVKCGADGSHFAVWKNRGNSEFVFLGSEGDAFKITSSVQKFVVLITMGYFSVEDRHALMSTPADNYSEYLDGKWPEPTDIKRHIQNTLGVGYPATGESLIDRDEEDPFAKWVNDILNKN